MTCTKREFEILELAVKDAGRHAYGASELVHARTAIALLESATITNAPGRDEARHAAKELADLLQSASLDLDRLAPGTLQAWLKLKQALTPANPNAGTVQPFPNGRFASKEKGGV